ncbi:hypothetical protein [Acidocella sp. MX-AZ03]|uniref:hypothetical protein n=1 Tax=Acidocella sp. MX-AZ03 TaxID=2697363 RepID=UPI002FD80ABC
MESSAKDILYSNLFTGVHGNYLIPSIKAAGLDPALLAGADPAKMEWSQVVNGSKAWRDIWGLARASALCATSSRRHLDRPAAR